MPPFHRFFAIGSSSGRASDDAFPGGVAEELILERLQLFPLSFLFSQRKRRRCFFFKRVRALFPSLSEFFRSQRRRPRTVRGPFPSASNRLRVIVVPLPTRAERAVSRVPPAALFSVNLFLSLDFHALRH